MSKILVIYASAGAGHRKAAEAVADAVRRRYPQADLSTVDALDYTNRFFKWLYPRTYLFLVSKASLIWAAGFYILDKRPVNFLLRPIRRFLNKLNARRLEEFLVSERFDAAVSTHFLPTEVIGSLKRKGAIRTKLINVVTDYGVHRLWVTGYPDIYTVATEATKRELIAKGAKDREIRVLGIPVNPVFGLKKENSSVSLNLGIKEGVFTVLIASGGFGVGPIKEIVQSLGGLKKRLQVLVVCGKNKRLYNDITSLAGTLDVPIKVFGFVDNMDELMEVSDVIVTKSGGMTTSESLAKGLPMIILAPIPGQESRNCRLLVSLGAALKAGDVEGAKKAISRLMNDRSALENIKDSISRVARPHAAFDIADIALQIAG